MDTTKLNVPLSKGEKLSVTNSRKSVILSWSVPMIKRGDKRNH